MVTFIGYIAIIYVVLQFLIKILKTKDKDRSWYEEPIFKDKDGTK